MPTRRRSPPPRPGPQLAARRRTPRRRNAFTERDARRIMRALNAEGGGWFRINRETGDMEVFPGQTPKDGAANPLDQWMANRADQVEGH
jgi:hypothetical protein